MPISLPGTVPQVLTRCLLVIVVVLLLGGCASAQDGGWDVVDPSLKRGRINLAFLLSGIPWTIALTICCVLISNVLGFLISLLGLSRRRSLIVIYRCYVEVFRSIPPLVSIFWVYYGLPILVDVGLLSQVYANFFSNAVKY